MQLLWFIVGVHLVACPFTKVEESFNIQAMHDLIYHRTNLTLYDHHEFPGVVPRTFIGPILVTLIVSPVYFILEMIGVEGFNKFCSQYLVRAALATCVLFSYSAFKKSVEKEFGSSVSKWLTIITVSQFHFLFYISRPLPNIMVLPFVLLAFSFWLKQRHVYLISLSAVAVIIFRFELALLFGPILLLEVILRKIDLLSVIKIGLIASLSSLIGTIAIDSVMWNRPLWPEGEVFWFNSILNKSIEYGTSPFLWYYYSALPRALGASLLFVPIGMFLDRRIRLLLIPPLIYIFAFSFLPHKELRFIIYTFPLLNLSTAYTCNRFLISATKSFSRWLLCVAALFHIVINVIITITLLSVAKDNYPGGMAIGKLHAYVPKEEQVHVYIDNIAAQTGVSRFTQLHDHWIYNKTENIDLDSKDIFLFSHLLLEAKSKHSKNLKPFSSTHTIVDVIEGFSHVAFNYNLFPPVKFKTKPMIYILKHNSHNSKIEEPIRSRKQLESLNIFNDFEENDEPNNSDDSIDAETSELLDDLPKNTNKNKLIQNDKDVDLENTKDATYKSMAKPLSPFNDKQKILKNSKIAKELKSDANNTPKLNGNRLAATVQQNMRLQEKDNVEIEKIKKHLKNQNQQMPDKSDNLEVKKDDLKSDLSEVNDNSTDLNVVDAKKENTNAKKILKRNLHNKENLMNDLKPEGEISFEPVNKLKMKDKKIIHDVSEKNKAIKFNDKDDIDFNQLNVSRIDTEELFNDLYIQESEKTKDAMNYKVKIKKDYKSHNDTHPYFENILFPEENSFLEIEDLVGEIYTQKNATKLTSSDNHPEKRLNNETDSKKIKTESEARQGGKRKNVTSAQNNSHIKDTAQRESYISNDKKLVYKETVEKKETDVIQENISETPKEIKNFQKTSKPSTSGVTNIKDTTIIYASRGKGTIAKSVATLKKKASQKEAEKSDSQKVLL